MSNITQCSGVLEPMVEKHKLGKKRHWNMGARERTQRITITCKSGRKTGTIVGGEESGAWIFWSFSPFKTRPDRGVRSLYSGETDRCRYSGNQGAGNVTEAGELNQEGWWQEQGSALA